MVPVRACGFAVDVPFRWDCDFVGFWVFAAPSGCAAVCSSRGSVDDNVWVAGVKCGGDELVVGEVAAAGYKDFHRSAQLKMLVVAACAQAIR